MNWDNALWFAYIGVEAVVIGLLLYRRIYRTLPVFCFYCFWDICSNVGTLLISHYSSPSGYFRVYFADTILDSALQIAVLIELAWSVLRPVHSWLPRSALVVVSALILVAGLAIWPFAAFPGITHTTKAALQLAQLQHTLSILRIAFFLLLAAGSQLLSIGWRDRELQVATGLGFYSIANLAISIVQSRQSTSFQYVHLQEFVVISFLCSLLYWVASFSQKEAERREFTPQMQKVLLAVAGSARTARVALSDARGSKTGKH